MTDFTLRPLTVPERKYTYAQSSQLQGQTGNIGYLRGDFGSSGDQFYTTWFDTRPQWKSDEFKRDLDDVINALRSEEYGLLQSRSQMVRYGRENKESEMQGAYTTEFGFRADTEKYVFVLRCNPTRGDYNFYCLCYVKEWLDKHIEEANRDIRFIDSHYKELFRIPDGERIIVTDRDGKTESYPCRYIDNYHTEVGRNLFHICEFAERMEQGGCTYAPMEPPLPPMCYSIMMYGAQNGITVKSNSDSELGMRLVAYLPELHCAVDIAGATVTEKREQSVKAHICQSNRLGYYLIKRTADASQMAAEIKTLFIRNHIYLHTDSEKDVQVLRERFLEWKNRNACKLNGKY